MSTIPELVRTLAIETRNGDLRNAPLLAQLRTAVAGNLGGSTSGASSAPVPLNIGAFEVWEDITGQIASAYASATEERPSHAPEKNLLLWYLEFTDAVLKGDTTQIQHEVAGERLQSWVDRIEEHFAAARTRELMVRCPNCLYDRITLGEGGDEVEGYVLVATIRDGEVTVTCRNPVCVDAFDERSEWKGEEQIAELGRRTGNPISQTAVREALHEQTQEPIDTDRELVPFEDGAAPHDLAALRSDRIGRLIRTWSNTPAGRAGDYLNLRRFIRKRLGREIADDEQAALVEGLREMGAISA